MMIANLLPHATTALVFLVILSILVLIHELGHFIAAKFFGIKVEEFGFGLPPRIFGIKKGETIYSINWLPIGGFVKLLGEDREEEEDGKKKELKDKDEKRAFYARPPIQRMIVLVAGVFMNFLLALSVNSFLFTQGVMVPTNRVHIESVLPSTPAQKVGLQEKDVIEEIKTKSSELKITSGDQLVKYTRDHLGEPMDLVVLRSGKELNVEITARKEYPKNEGPLGIVISNYEQKVYPWYQAPIMGTKESLNLTWELLKGIGMILYKLVTFQSVSQDVAGPIGIAVMTGQAVKYGRSAVFDLLSLLSLNLAIVNLLPFPALDGGRFVFVFIEAVFHKKVEKNMEKILHQIGFAVLLLFIVLVSLNDILRYLHGKGLLH